MDLTAVVVPAGTAEAYVARPTSGSGPGVLFFMDAIGLRPAIATIVDRIASWGYVVLAPNVFHREGSVDDVGPHADLREPGAREDFFAQAMPRVARLTAERAVGDIAAYVEALQHLAGVRGEKVGTTGYCMGARLAVRTGTGHPGVVAAVGGFHGGGLVTDEPDSPHRALGSARAAFVFGHADRDRSMPPDAVQTLGEALTAARLDAVNEVYPGAPHGYTMADTSTYDESAAERHFAALEELFARVL